MSVWLKLRTRIPLRWVLVLIASGLLVWIVHSWWNGRQIRYLQATCELSRKSGNWDELERLATRLRSYEPSSGQPLLYLAESAQMKGQLQQAADYLGQFPESDVRAPLVLVEKANLEWGDLNRPWDALQTCESTIRLRPNTIYAHARIISFQAMTLQRPELLASIRRAIKMRAEPREAYAYLMMADALTFANATALNKRWRSSDPQSPFFQIAVAVQTAIDRDLHATAEPNPQTEANFRQARETVEELQQRYPGDRVLLGFLLGKSIEEGNVSRVEELLGHVSSDVAGDHLLWIHRGWYHTIRGELDAAEIALKKALELHPLSWLARQEYATLLRRKQSLEAVEEMQQLSLEGREIRKELLKLPNARDIPEELLKRIAGYADSCGDHLVFEALKQRLSLPEGWKLHTD